MQINIKFRKVCLGTEYELADQIVVCWVLNNLNTKKNHTCPKNVWW